MYSGVPKLPQSPTASVKNGSADHTVTRAATASNDEADIQSYQVHMLATII
eukprot:m.54072 g.54072  ORF g.54072 m.54072 type:complete len:51 (+) comp10897_c0_seq2:795-947(+)